MNLDERLAEGIREGVDRAGQRGLLGRGDVGGVMVRGRRLRRRRRGLAVTAVGVVTGAVVVAASLLGGTDPLPPTPPADHLGPALVGGTWAAGAESPLGPRYGSLVYGVGEEVLVVGGTPTMPCLERAYCQPGAHLPDAAVYDVSANAWREVPDPPIGPGQVRGGVTLDEFVYLGAEGAWMSFDLASDTWDLVAMPKVPVVAPLAATAGLIYTRARGDEAQVWVYDVDREAWSSLPADPLSPSLTDTQVFATDAGIVLTGVADREPAVDDPPLVMADLWDGDTWSRLPATGQVGPLTHWTGSRLVGLQPGTADGGSPSGGWGATYPQGGALDPATGQWAPVVGLDRSAPTALSDTREASDVTDWEVEASGGPLMATRGRVYDDRSRTWINLDRPRSPVDVELSGAWAQGRLVVVGGYDLDNPTPSSLSITPRGLSSQTWIWTPQYELSRDEGAQPVPRALSCPGTQRSVGDTPFYASGQGLPSPEAVVEAWLGSATGEVAGSDYVVEVGGEVAWVLRRDGTARARLHIQRASGGGYLYYGHEACSP